MSPTSPTMSAGCATRSVTAIGPENGATTGKRVLIMLTANSAAVLLKTRTTASSSAPRCCRYRRIDTAKST